MSEEEIVSAYVRGALSRRQLIRRLVAGGMGFAAAVTYAHVLNPSKARAARPSDFYHPEHPPHPVPPDQRPPGPPAGRPPGPPPGRPPR
jgi:hypothetical protein